MKKKRSDVEHSRKRIIKELEENPRGFTASELSKKINVSRQTISNCFGFLEGAKMVKTRQVGMARLYFWVKNGEKI